MKFCFGTVCWGGYLERYVDIFANNYITIYRKLTNLGVNYADITNPKIVHNGDNVGQMTERAIKKIELVTGKKLELIQDKHKYTENTIMYSTRNRLRSEFKKSYPSEKKVFFYFPIDDNVRPDVAIELVKLSKANQPTACMFKFLVSEGSGKYMAATRPICSYKDIHSGDWGGYCAYNILDEEKCPLYPEIAIPNVAFYVELYKAGYVQYPSQVICVDHLRHPDSHHFRVKNTDISKKVKDFLLKQIEDLKKEHYK